MTQDNNIDLNNLGDLILDKSTTTPRSPLKDFEGVFTDVKGDYKQSGRDQKRSVLELKLNFTSVKVYETQPGQVYPYPIAELVVSHSVSQQSAYAILATSVAEIMGRPVKFAELFGHKMRMKYTSGHQVQRPDPKNPSGKWVDTTIDAWEIVQIDDKGKANVTSNIQPNNSGGSANVDITTIIISLADGKNIKEIGKALITTPGLPDNLRQISIEGQEETLINGLVASKHLTVDGVGVYHKV